MSEESVFGDDQAGREQARALRDKARASGLWFDAYLPSDLADWLLKMVEDGVFADPSEAVFVILGQFRELEPHHDLRTELLRRMLEAAENDPRPTIPAEEVFSELRKQISEPARWQRAN